MFSDLERPMEDGLRWEGGEKPDRRLQKSLDGRSQGLSKGCRRKRGHRKY